MAKQYYDGLPREYETKFHEALALMSNEAENAYFEIRLEDIDGSYNIYIEAHENCDNNKHENCTIVGHMYRPAGNTYERAYKFAQMTYDATVSAFGKDRVTLNAGVSVNN